MNYWPTKKLGEICEENIKSPFKVENATNSGEYPFFTSGDNILTHDEYLVDGENIFLATGGYANVKYYNGKASYSTDTWSLKVKNGLAKFVFYQILARLKYIDEVLFRGSGLRHLQKKEFFKLEILLPPLPIQQKIVKILDMIQEAVNIQEKIIEKTKELKKSLMNLLFHYGIKALSIKELASSRVGELTSSEIEKLGLKLKKTEIGEIPENWEVVRLGEVIEILDSKRIPLSEEERQNMKGPYPYCGANGIIDYINNYIFEGEYVLLAEDGGYWGPFEESSYIMKGKFWVNNHAHIFRALKNKAINFCLMSILNYLNLNDYISGATRGKLNQSTMRNIKIPLPPLPEQQEITEILQIIDQKIEIEKKKKELYEELFKTMLHKIMSQEIDINLLDY